MSDATLQTTGQTIGMVGLFDNVDQLTEAAKKIRDAGFTRWDCHTPYPVHGLEHAMGLKESIVPCIAITAAFVGLAAALLLTWGLHAEGYYPIRVGGKPLFSWPAFVPIYFELFVLFAAFATMGAVFYLCKLFRWHSPLHDTGIAADITTDRFAVVIEASDEKFDEAQCRTLLETAGCADIRELKVNIDDEATL